MALKSQITTLHSLHGRCEEHM